MENRKEPEKAANYDRIAREVFLPIFPLIAREALGFYGRETGKCLDVGSGGGMFGYFILLLSEMHVTFLDCAEDAIEVCRRRGFAWGLDDRSDYIIADVHDMSAIPDGSYDLVVSRGSIPFWGSGEELVQAFREIERVLAPGGTALIGGSLGTSRMSGAITKKMRERIPDWQPPETRDGGCVTGYDKREKLLNEAGIAYRKVMVEQNMDLAKELGIRQAPTLIVGGETPEKLIGVGAIRKFITDGVKVC